MKTKQKYYNVLARNKLLKLNSFKTKIAKT